MIARSTRILVRNAAGYALVLFGFLISLPGVPGPGFAVVLLGLTLADWPGKLRFFRWLRGFPWFQACDDWVHRWVGRRLPAHPADEPAPPAPRERC